MSTVIRGPRGREGSIRRARRGRTHQILVQVLADVRRQLHRADEDEEYAEEHRERLEHYRAHLVAGWTMSRTSREEYRGNAPPIDRRGGSVTRRGTAARSERGYLPRREGRRTGGEGESRGTCSSRASVGGRGDGVRGADHPDVL